ncbi:hypothetical protein [Shinella zoogloeoides]|uniref:hypothetical protein n=1 Tax=Shinella zoogloeoides TaxID=352475 RepID=UPI00273FE154|nr:hypothetical protein [Shinella zoogloeoides]WLR91014.1 hypothetical protein Q9316_00265 [Shinella zoogloeoides]
MKLNLRKDLEPLKCEKLAQIDADANRALESYRTSGDIAALVYKLKRDEVSEADAGRPLNELAMLQAEAFATKVPASDLLELWRRKIQDEDAFIIVIEATRQKLKARTRAAQTPAEIEMILFSPPSQS